MAWQKYRPMAEKSTDPWLGKIVIATLKNKMFKLKKKLMITFFNEYLLYKFVFK